MNSSEVSFDERINTWEEALENFRACVMSIDDWSIASPCPGWSIADLVAHTIDLEAMLAADPRPAHTPDWGSLPHITNDFGRLTEVGVDYRRGADPAEMLAELSDVHARALARVKELGADGEIPWVRGNTPIAQVLGFRAFDLWTHEQDARYATDQPGNLSGAGAENARDYFLGALPRLWVKGAGAHPGDVLHFEVTGPQVTASVHVAVDDEGRAHVVEGADAATTISLPWMSYVLLASGRDVSNEIRGSVVIEGNIDLGEALVKAMAVTP